MDSILKPELVWINGSCFRKNPLKDDPFGDAAAAGDTQDLYDDDDDHAAGGDGDEYGSGNHHQVEELGSGKFKVVMNVASAFFPMIIGKKGTTKKRIEAETKTRISVPRPGNNSSEGDQGALTVTGSAKNQVLSACHRIDLIVESSRSRMGFTHFISLPLNTQDLQQSFKIFKEQVLESVASEPYSIRRIDDSIFQTPSLLHLTIGVLALMGN